MTGIIHYGTFLFTGILLNLTPGNDTLFILSRSIARGKNAGIMSALGIGTGSLLHTTLAAFGLSLIIARSLLLFTIIKFGGAAYLVYIGLKMCIGRSATDFSPMQVTGTPGFKQIYRDAVITNVLNPKVALFFIAFLPQFIDPAHRDSVLPFLILGLSFTITGTAWCLVLAIFSASLFSALRNKPRFASGLNKICGFTMVALGIKVALTDRK